MMKKYSWIAALVLALSLAFMGCPDGGGKGGGGNNNTTETDNVDWGTEPGMQPSLYGTSQPTWNDTNKTLTIKASSSTGFSWTWAELTEAAGQPISRDTVGLIVIYQIDVKTPAAALTIKNPADMAANPKDPTTGADIWGQGKGAEYVLGDNTLSNFEAGGEKIVSSYYNPATGRGWFEINPLVHPATSTGIGFVHNFWCDMGGVTAENSEYRLKILRIAPRCCEDKCDITTTPDCLAGRCIDDCYDEDDNPNGTCCLPADVEAPFVAVTGITGVPAAGTVDVALALTATVAPANATNKDIAWEVKTDGGTNSVITGSSLTATAAGTVTVTATIEDGEAVGTNYTEDFDIVISAFDGYVINNPTMTHAPGSHSTWSGTDNEDGSFTITTGGLRYAWPTATAEFDISEYDFVEVQYTASGANSTMVKHYAVAEDFDPFSGSKNISNGDNVFKLEIRNDAEGFAIQKYQAGTGDLTIKFTKLIFTKGTRHTVTLDPDGGTVSPTSTYLVEDTKVGTHLPTPSKPGNNFGGWKLGSDAITASTTVTSAFANATLVAQWSAAVAVTPFTVDFTGKEFRKIGNPTVDVIESGAGYEYTYGSGSGNNWSLAAFKVTLEAGASLADYDTITFDYDAIAGDARYKDMMLIDATTATSGGFGYAALAVTDQKANGVEIGSQATIVLTIDKTKAASLTGEIEVAFFMNAGAGADPLTKFSIKNVVFGVNP